MNKAPVPLVFPVWTHANGLLLGLKSINGSHTKPAVNRYKGHRGELASTLLWSPNPMVQKQTHCWFPNGGQCFSISEDPAMSVEEMRGKQSSTEEDGNQSLLAHPNHTHVCSKEIALMNNTHYLQLIRFVLYEEARPHMLTYLSPWAIHSNLWKSSWVMLGREMSESSFHRNQQFSWDDQTTHFI